MTLVSRYSTRIGKFRAPCNCILSAAFQKGTRLVLLTLFCAPLQACTVCPLIDQ